MSLSYSYELSIARRAALDAGQIIAKYYTQALKPTYKVNNSPVTRADRDSNDIIKSILRKTFPNDGWLSEEDVDDMTRFEKKRVWIVDPLDGTRDFIRKTPEFAVAIALVENHKPVLGVIYNPITKELFTAVTGQSAFCNNQKIHVAKTEGLAKKTKTRLLISLSENRRGEWDRFKTFFDVIPTGGCAYKMAKIARGDADGAFTLSPKSEWDVCAGELVIQEAGGIVTYVDATPIRYNQPSTIMDGLVYCSNHQIHKEILKAIGE